MAVRITDVLEGSLAKGCGIRSGDKILSINGNNITDVLDYQFYCTDTLLTIDLMSPEKGKYTVTIEKDEYEDIGLVFDDYLMDKQRHCRNKCVFCFIDQLPKGLRESLYFKDDDSRLSFLFGNYITLTNVTEEEINRIIKMRISPINVSVHTTNPELRVKMMGNPKAGQALKFLRQLSDAGIDLNCQIVLCPGINDGKELDRTLTDLSSLYPSLKSIAVVPVGLTRFRKGLFEVKGYDKDSALEVIRKVEAFGEEFKKKHGTRLAYPADEFYIKAKMPLPSEEFYEDFSQLENGIGMIALFTSQYREALEIADLPDRGRNVSIATGVAAQPFIASLIDETVKRCNNLKCKVFAVRNDFFGDNIDVAGLVIGRDLIDQLCEKDLGDELLIPSVMLRREGDMFLDDLTPEDVEKALGVPVRVVPADGEKLLSALIGLDS